MDEVRDRIEKELASVMARLRQLGGAVAVDELPGAVGDNSPFADLTEGIQVHGEREVSMASRSLLVERANRLAEALDRLREGQYGTCQECGGPIAPARLKVMPEVTTCVHCQDRLERTARQPSQEDMAFLKTVRKRNRRHLRRPDGLLS